MKTQQAARLHTLFALVACGGLMASCAAPPAAAPSAVVPKPASTATPAPPATLPVPAAAPAPSPAAVSAPAPAAVTAATAQSAQRQAASAVDMLEAGQEEQAIAELQRALQNDPNNKLAQSLMRQIQSDPLAVLGREYFQYRVQPGESLSKIAQRFMGDLYQFYILARYNDMRVPKQLQAGQVIKVPGKAPSSAAAPPVAAPSPPSPPPPPPPPSPPPPPPSPVPAPMANTPAAPAPAVDAAKVAERERLARVVTESKAARAAYARQDLLKAIVHWDIVLNLDPGNNSAKIERQRAVELKAKLDRLPR